MRIIDKYNKRVDDVNSLLCVGLDSHIDRIPDRFRTLEYPLFEFNKYIIEQTHPYVSAYKPNMAFYEGDGEIGWYQLRLTIEHLRANHPTITTICDAKRADIGNTNAHYVRAFFDDLGFDAITLHPYLGKEALKPFLEREDKACIILCRTSNEGSGEFQDITISGRPLWEHIAVKVARDWNTHNNCMLVMGATYPKEIQRVRQVIGELTLLVPGIGEQGGAVEPTVTSGVNHQYKGLILSASRSVIYDADPAKAAMTLRNSINAFRS